MNMPVIVPVKPVMAEKISLFHLPRNAMWAVSSADRQRVMATANFTPKTSLSSGEISSVCWLVRVVLFCTVLVNACLIQSFMVSHTLLFDSS